MQQLSIVAVVDVQIFARRRKQALPVRTGAFRKLFVTCGLSEICSRPADIVDIPFKIWIFDQDARFLYNGSMASALDQPALVKRQRAKIASAKAAPAADKAEFDLPDRRHAASGFITSSISNWLSGLEAGFCTI